MKDKSELNNKKELYAEHASQTSNKLFPSNITNNFLSAEEILSKIIEQYETLPYPYVDPKNELNTPLKEGSPSNILEIANYIFNGRRDFTQPFRVLVAGGGTGDASTALGYRLKHLGCTNAEIIHLDLSNASQKIAAERAQLREIDNVKFINGSILDVEKLNLGKFDYIDCCGVLHHLPDPREGFRLLSNLLKEEGGMGIMVYGALGRIGVYYVQEMLKMIQDPNTSVTEKAKTAQTMITQLPSSNWMIKNEHIYIKNKEDNEIYDLFCHVKDKAYRVNELVSLLDSLDMKIQSFIPSYQYNPLLYLSDPAIISKVEVLSKENQWTFAELLCCSMNKHVFYTVKKSNKTEPLSLDQEDNIPILAQLIKDRYSTYKVGSILPAFSLASNTAVAHITLPPLSSYIIHAIDNKKTIKQTYEQIMLEYSDKINIDHLKEDFNELYNTLNSIGLIFLNLYPIQIKD